MSKERPSIAAPILAVLAVVLVTLGVYVGGYFWLADIVAKTNTSIIRCYPYPWQVAAFTPLARAEVAIRGGEVRAVILLTTSQVQRSFVKKRPAT